MSKKIVFDFDEFKEWIENIEYDTFEDGVETIYREFRVLDSGEVQTRKHRIVKDVTLWHTFMKLKSARVEEKK